MESPEKFQKKSSLKEKFKGLRLFSGTSDRTEESVDRPSSSRTSSSPPTTEEVSGQKHTATKDSASTSKEPMSHPPEGDGLVADGGCLPNSQKDYDSLMKKVNDTKSDFERATGSEEVFGKPEVLKELMEELRQWKPDYDKVEKPGKSGKPGNRFEQSLVLCDIVLGKLGDGFLKAGDSVQKLSDSQVFRWTGQVHWAGLLLSGIAFILHNWRVRAANKEQFKKTFDKILLLGEHVLVIIETVDDHNRVAAIVVQQAVGVIFTGILESIKAVKKDKNLFARFIFADITNDLLKKHEMEVDTTIFYLTSTVSLDNHGLLLKIHTMLKNLTNSRPVSTDDKGASAADSQALTTGAAQVIPRESGSSGVKQINENLYEFVLDSSKQSEPRNANLVLIFFHGLQLDDSVNKEDIHWKTWTFSDQPQTCWPAKMMSEDSDLEDEDIMVRSFAAKYDASMYKTDKEGRLDIYSIGKNFTEFVIRSVMRKLEKSKPIPSIVLVAHSYGGIVIQEMIKHAYWAARSTRDERQIQFLRSLRGIFFYSTPHGGLTQDVFDVILSVRSSTTASNSPGALLLQPSPGALVEWLQQHDKHLARSREDFIKNLGAIPNHEVIRSGKRIKTQSVVESWNTSSGNWKGGIEITREAAAGVENVPLCINADHFGITKPLSGGFGDNKYVCLRDFILTTVESERQELPRGPTRVDHLSHR